MIGQEIHLPAGSLNEIVRIYMPHPLESRISPTDGVVEAVSDDVRRGDTRGMYFQNPSEVGI